LLLCEFQEYAQGKGRLRLFRTEAVRAGLKHARHERDYRTIVHAAERLPPSVQQDDAGLLMYYDNALMGPSQSRCKGDCRRGGQKLRLATLYGMFYSWE